MASAAVVNELKVSSHWRRQEPSVASIAYVVSKFGLLDGADGRWRS